VDYGTVPGIGLAICDPEPDFKPARSSSRRDPTRFGSYEADDRYFSKNLAQRRTRSRLGTFGLPDTLRRREKTTKASKCQFAVLVARRSTGCRRGCLTKRLSPRAANQKIAESKTTRKKNQKNGSTAGLCRPSVTTNHFLRRLSVSRARLAVTTSTYPAPRGWPERVD